MCLKLLTLWSKIIREKSWNWFFFYLFFTFSGDSPYFTGGYITQIHSKDHFDAIQIETPRDLRIDKGDEAREHFGDALGRAICDFYEFHYMN